MPRAVEENRVESVPRGADTRNAFQRYTRLIAPPFFSIAARTEPMWAASETATITEERPGTGALATDGGSAAATDGAKTARSTAAAKREVIARARCLGTGSHPFVMRCCRRR